MEGTNFFLEIKTFSTILHVGSAVIAMGAALMADFLFNFYSKDKVLNRTEIKTLNLLSGVVWYGLLALVISGLMLFFSDTAKYIASVKFLAKMSILGILVINGFVLSKVVWPRLSHKNFLTSSKERKTRKLAFALGTVSVVSWSFVLILGVMSRTWLPYQGVMAIYLLVLLVGIPISLALEKKLFN